MTTETILLNTFFAYFDSFGKYFFLIICYAWFLGIVLFLVHILTKK